MITHLIAVAMYDIDRVIAPHRFSILMLMFALAWGYNFCAPAFRKGRRK